MSAEASDAQEAQLKQEVSGDQKPDLVTAEDNSSMDADADGEADVEADADAEADGQAEEVESKAKTDADDAVDQSQERPDQGAPQPVKTETTEQSATTSTPAPPQEPQVQLQAPQAGVSGSKQPLQPLKHMTVEQRKQLFEDRIKIDPRDGEAWLNLIEEAQSREDMEATRALYDRFFAVFPNQARQWLAYLELELAHGNFAQVEAIFNRCLRTTPSVDLWKFYLSYTRRVNPLPPSTGAEEDAARETARNVLENAYEFALRFIGNDKDSGSIWTDYISLVKEREARGGWKEGKKMDDLRRVYQRAVSVPLSNIEAIWKDYDAYENGLNKLTAKKFLAERSPAYMTARRVLRDLKAYTDPLVKPLLPRPPIWTSSALPGDAGEGPGAMAARARTGRSMDRVPQMGGVQSFAA